MSDLLKEQQEAHASHWWRQTLLIAIKDAERAAASVPCDCKLKPPLDTHEQWCWKPRLENVVRLVREQVK